MNYQQALDFLEEIKKYGSKPGLEAVRRLAAELGNPQEKLKLVHIAGTNAKGTVGAMIAACLKEAGYKTGYFSSPPVYAYEETFQINGKLITQEELAQVFSVVKKACGSMLQKGLAHPTKFEAETAAAFLWFYQSNVDIAVIEAGMGGTLDATNVFSEPLVSVLTPISFDHMKFLGNSLTEIARHKAGIIKSGCPVVSFPQEAEVMDVISGTCREKQAPLWVTGDDQAEVIYQGRSGSRFTCHFMKKPSPGRKTASEKNSSENVFPGSASVKAGSEDIFTISLPGFHNIRNAICALQVLEILKEGFPQITSAAEKRGLAGIRMPGRLERLQTKPGQPEFLLDGGHNPAAVKSLRKTLDSFFADKKTVYIMGVLADKDYEANIDIMFPQKEGQAYRVFTVTPPNPRALSGEKLAEALNCKGCAAFSCDSAVQAVRKAAQAAGADGMVVVFGSFTILAGIKAVLPG